MLDTKISHEGVKDKLIDLKSTRSGNLSSSQNMLHDSWVVVTKLDSFIHKNIPNGLKVDVEEHNFQVLKGAYKVIKRCLPSLIG